MATKNLKIHVYLFFFAFVFVAALSLNDAGSEEIAWKFMGKTKDKNFLVYYSPASVNYITETYVRLTLKKERSQEGIEQFKQDFKANLKEAEDKAGERLKDDPGPLLNMLLKRETRIRTVDIDCVSNELRVPPEKMSGFNMVVVDDIEPGTAIENIRNEVCKKQPPDKKE